MAIELTVLGSNSALFAHGRHMTSQLVVVGNQHWLVDCGEGTQIRIGRFGVKPGKITHIFISHLHGDHYFGLVGLLSSMHLLGRSKGLTIYGPIGLSEIITTQFRYSKTALKFPIQFVELRKTKPETIFENESYSATTIPLKHKVYCNGILFREKKGRRRIDKDRLTSDMTIKEIRKLAGGEDVLDENGSVKYKNEDYTMEPKKPSSYAFCTDTSPLKSVVEEVKGVDLLYHEATFTEDEVLRAAETFHSTARQAADIAKKAKVGQLMLGHYSSRYDSLDKILQEAKSVFNNTIASIEGETYVI